MIFLHQASERTIQASEAALKTQSDPPLERVCQIQFRHARWFFRFHLISI
jgi:hypothetical protein